MSLHKCSSHAQKSRNKTRHSTISPCREKNKGTSNKRRKNAGEKKQRTTLTQNRLFWIYRSIFVCRLDEAIWQCQTEANARRTNGTKTRRKMKWQSEVKHDRIQLNCILAKSARSKCKCTRRDVCFVSHWCLRGFADFVVVIAIIVNFIRRLSFLCLRRRKSCCDVAALCVCLCFTESPSEFSTLNAHRWERKNRRKCEKKKGKRNYFVRRFWFEFLYTVACLTQVPHHLMTHD